MYIIKETGGAFDIGALLDYTDGRTIVNMGFVDDNLFGSMEGGQVAVSAGIANDLIARLTVTGDIARSSIGTVAWLTPLNQTVIEVEDGGVFEAGQILAVSGGTGSDENLLVESVNDNVITVERGYGETTAELLEDGLTLTVINHGSETVGAYLADAEDTEITVVDGSQFAVGDTITTAAGETIEVVGFDEEDGNILIVERDELNLGIIGDGEFLAVNGISSDIAVGNVWSDTTTRTILNVSSTNILRVGDILIASGSSEKMLIEHIDGVAKTITVERGYDDTTPEELSNSQMLTVDNRLALIPLGSNTIVVGNSGENVIVPRNIPVQVVSEAAYEQLFEASDTQAIKADTDELQAIKANTDNLPAIKAETDNLPAIKAKTDNLPDLPASEKPSGSRFGF